MTNQDLQLKCGTRIMEVSMKNIWEIINNFNAVFGEKPISVKADFVSGVHIFIKMLYDEHVDIPKTGISGDWNEFSHCGNNHGIVRIWVTRDEKTKAPKLVLFYDNIYINRYTMPDQAKAMRFCDARERFAGGYASLKICSEKVVLGNRLLNAFIAKTEQNINQKKEWIATDTDLNRVQEYAKDIADSIDTLKILKEIREAQTKK